MERIGVWKLSLGTTIIISAETMLFRESRSVCLSLFRTLGGATHTSVFARACVAHNPSGPLSLAYVHLQIFHISILLIWALKIHGFSSNGLSISEQIPPVWPCFHFWNINYEPHVTEIPFVMWYLVNFWKFGLCNAIYLSSVRFYSLPSFWSLNAFLW